MTPGFSCLNSKWGVRLAPCESEHFESFRIWRNDVRLLPTFWNHQIEDTTGQRLLAELEQLLAQTVFLVVQREGQTRPLGFVSAKGCASPVQRHLNVTVFLENRDRGRGCGIAAAGLLIRYLFESFDIPKLVFEVYGWDQSSVEIMKRILQFRQEGLRPDHVHLNGRLCDLFEFALCRDDFEVLRETPLWKRTVG
jgi:RimJ/RimL family protein N-acetyltransferase